MTARSTPFSRSRTRSCKQSSVQYRGILVESQSSTRAGGRRRTSQPSTICCGDVGLCFTPLMVCKVPWFIWRKRSRPIRTMRPRTRRSPPPLPMASMRWALNRRLRSNARAIMRRAQWRSTAAIPKSMRLPLPPISRAACMSLPIFTPRVQWRATRTIHRLSSAADLFSPIWVGHPRQSKSFPECRGSTLWHLMMPGQRCCATATSCWESAKQTLSFFRLPLPHHKHMKSTNMLERLNREIKRRTLVVRIFPNPQSCLRLVRALAVEIHEN
jgi:Transposase, Mutator family